MRPLHTEPPDLVDLGITEQIEQLRKAADVSESSKLLPGVTKEAAILNALVSADCTRRLRAAITELATTLDRYEAAAAKREETAAASERRLADWTAVMGWTTIALAVFAAAQVIVAGLQLATDRGWL